MLLFDLFHAETTDIFSRMRRECVPGSLLKVKEKESARDEASCVPTLDLQLTQVVYVTFYSIQVMQDCCMDLKM